MADKCLDVRDGGNCNQLGSYIDWHCYRIDCNQHGLCIDEYIIESIAISLDFILMDSDDGVDGVFNSRFDGGFNGWFHLAVLGYQPQ